MVRHGSRAKHNGPYGSQLQWDIGSWDTVSDRPIAQPGTTHHCPRQVYSTWGVYDIAAEALYCDDDDDDDDDDDGGGGDGDVFIPELKAVDKINAACREGEETIIR